MKRILFVDDEPRVLEGLQRMLRPFRKEWDMVFVASGQAALETLFAEEEPFEVIVSDMRMPGMDGATLLKLVQEQYPNLVRIVLSGYSEMEAALRAVPVAHQFLAKPCDPATLKSVIERASSLHALLNDEAIRGIVSSMDSLPACPQAYTALLQALADPNAGLREVADLVERDLALTAKCMQLVNSAFFGLARRVNSIHQAVTYLGAGMLRTLVLTVEVFREAEGRRFPGFSLEGLQTHCLLTARLASGLIEDKQASDDAFMAAMLHDIGKIVLATRLPDRFRALLSEQRARKQPLHVVEQEIHGVTHAEIGAYLLGLWGLPYPIVEAVAHHHAPTRVPQEGFGVLGAVYVANLLCAEGTEHLSAPEALDDAYLDALGVRERLPAWRARAAELAATPVQ